MMMCYGPAKESFQVLSSLPKERSRQATATRRTQPHGLIMHVFHPGLRIILPVKKFQWKRITDWIYRKFSTALDELPALSQTIFVFVEKARLIPISLSIIKITSIYRILPTYGVEIIYRWINTEEPSESQKIHDHQK